MAFESDSRLTMCAALAGRNRPMRRAVVWASAIVIASGVANRSTPTAVRAATSSPSTTSCRLRRAAAPSRGPLRSSTVTLSMPGVRDQPFVTGDESVVEDHHQLFEPLGRLGVAAEPAAFGQLGGQRGLQQFQRGEQQPHRPHAVAGHRVLGVRQPLDPAPGLAVGVGRHHRDLDVIGSVKCAQLQHHRADELLSQLAFTLEGDGGEGAQRHRGRQCVHHRMRLDEPAQRHRRHRFEILGRAGLGGQQPRREPVGADADAHVAVVGVGGPAFPHSAGADHIGKCARVGMAPFQGGALLAAGGVGLLAQVG